MPQKKLTIEEKLNKYKIPLDRYNNESARLKEKEFTQEQANKIILRLSSQKTVKAVLCKYDKLSKQPYSLSHSQIVSIASHYGSAPALNTVQKSYKALQEIGFSKDQIVDIASNMGGANALNTILNSYIKLQTLGLHKDKIADIASSTGGAQTMQTMIKSYNQLKTLGFSAKQITDIASKNCGAQAMKTVLQSYEQLQTLGLSNEQIIDIASQNCGAQAIKTVLQSYEQLQTLGFSNEQIIHIVSRNDGSQLMKTVLQSYEQLQTLGFSNEQIVGMASRTRGAREIKTVLQSYEQLQTLGFRKEQIIDISSNGRYLAIQRVLKYYQELSSYGYSLENITVLAAQYNGAKNIQKIYEKELSDLPITNDQETLNLNTAYNDPNFLSIFCFGDETTKNSYIDVCLDDKEALQSLCEEDWNPDPAPSLSETINEDDWIFFNSFFTQSSGCKRVREDKTTENHCEKFLKETLESTPSTPEEYDENLTAMMHG